MHSIDDVLREGDFWPMPYIDGKQPYGDRTGFQIDLAELLGEPDKRGVRGNLIEDAEKGHARRASPPRNAYRPTGISDACRADLAGLIA
ncbi:hypothetical protein [Burkholderia sp. Ac-20344]|uniref:hypothetical protein n=1 Tax=Burkholderia sp. Ac-20344 TaxID=2703890 RepID=UPI00197C0425|nr:hypothetical protein [Burkholderia sp. Ac-20344]MBN3833311.1 hypothetical protein [Burkholderia sp. Ac-20344]